MKSIGKRLSDVEKAIGARLSFKIIVSLTDGTEIVTDTAGVWDLYKDTEQRKKIAGVKAAHESCAETARLIEVLCGVGV